MVAHKLDFFQRNQEVKVLIKIRNRYGFLEFLRRQALSKKIRNGTLRCAYTFLPTPPQHDYCIS